MKILLGDLGWIFAALAAIGLLYTVATTLFVGSFFRRRTPAAGRGIPDWGSVSIVKPLHGAERGLRENLETFLRLQAPVPLELLFGAQHPGDPALQVVESLIADHTDAAASQARICLDDAVHGHNRKISNVINIYEQASGEVLVLSDSDIAVPRDYLERVLESLSEPGVGVVTCPYVGKGEGGFWPEFAAMWQSYSFLPNVIAGVTLGLAEPCMGSTVALRRDTLEQIGGFRVFRDALADDYAVGVAVRALGLKSVVAPVLVSHSCTEKTLRTLFAHEVRWAKTVKGVDPAGHVGSVITHPMPLALLAALLLGFAPGPNILLAATLMARMGLMSAIDRAAGRTLSPWWMIPVRDLVTFAVFLASFLGRGVEW
ncbi:MAG: bacteriohopanetetrol glucosamine biosynthesis glycosyltransferase HpnI, partial [Caulobacteraceae bacterium]|nr:bacteriohopanetetrol glucosamine biosynthesis glycosyltransferase HpnI [Caulobacteraceae bacterium]